ncbi:MAG: hypothetical protein QM718_09945 [Steroidobacteraceae bacterium]
MRKSSWLTMLMLTSMPTWADDELTAVEARWIKAATPVLDYAASHAIPVDIIVQPQAEPGAAPFAMAIDDGHCKLVLSMRGNPDAEAVLKGVPASQVNDAIEAMTAHEVAHCWRYQQGFWHATPAGFEDKDDDVGTDAAADAASATALDQRREMVETRREEAYADLVGLAWTSARHPRQYGQVYGWLQQVRADPPTEGSYHDTRVWLSLASDPRVFAGDTIFDQAQPLWKKGLRKLITARP